jgi:maltooligosyltrehalose trehalohydrolase
MSPAEGVPLGARSEAAGVRFTVWSDKTREVSVVLYDRPGEPSREIPLGRADEEHTYTGFVRQLRAGALYDFKLDGRLAVDPYARSLPYGVHGPAEVSPPLPPGNHAKRAIDLRHGEVLYELHIGTFTSEGTFEGALRRLPELRELGVTTIELMPIAAFPGKRGWGYDGVGLFAPFAAYGSPEQLNAFVDGVHAQGMSVLLDVVYNHLGPDGNALPAFSDSYFDGQRRTPWGAAPALEKPPFRRLICDNVRYWLETVGFDGLRLDATHELEPGGDPHILAAISRIARACTPPAVLMAEDGRNDPNLLLEHGVNAVWSDDFHHAAHVLLTREQEGYYAGFSGELSELSRVIERGQLYEGQVFGPSGKARGKPPVDVAHERFVFALQNHDQIGNRAHGERLRALSSSDAYRAASVLLLFLPSTPLLFMGQEWASSSPFLFFSDHAGDIGHAVSKGRRAEFAHFSAFRDSDPDSLPDPQAESSFLRSKLDWSERRSPEHAQTLSLYRRALELRRTDPVLRAATELRTGVIGETLWVLRTSTIGERLLLFNAGAPTALEEVAGRSAPEARVLLSSRELTTGSAFELSAMTTTIFGLYPNPGKRER